MPAEMLHSETNNKNRAGEKERGAVNMTCWPFLCLVFLNLEPALVSTSRQAFLLGHVTVNFGSLRKRPPFQQAKFTLGQEQTQKQEVFSATPSISEPGDQTQERGNSPSSALTSHRYLYRCSVLTFRIHSTPRLTLDDAWMVEIGADLLSQG